MDDESRWQKQVVIGLVLLLVVGALIGAIVAFAGIKVAGLAGINNDSSTAKSTSRLHVPHNADTPGGNANSPGDAAPTTSGTTKPTHQPSTVISLTISPTTAATYARINLSGTYHAPDGSTLQVQREEGGSWVNFPTTATVSGGRFATYVETGQSGINRFRVSDIFRGVSSRAAVVTVE